MTNRRRGAMLKSIISGAAAIAFGALCALGPNAASAQAPAKGYLEPLSAENSVLLLVDIQPQFIFSTGSIDAHTLINNATGLTKAAQVFKVPTILATIS